MQDLYQKLAIFSKKQLDSRCVQHTAPHFQASLSGCDMLYTIDNIYHFFLKILLAFLAYMHFLYYLCTRF